MAGELRLSPYTSKDFNECEATKNFVLDFAYRCKVKRVDPFTKIILTALGVVPESNTADVKASNQRVLSKLPNLGSHVLKSTTREYDIPQQTTRQYDVVLASPVLANVGVGPQTETWDLGFNVDGSSTFNDAYFVRDYAVGYLYNSTNPVSPVQEMVLIIGRNPSTAEITVLRNHDAEGRPMPAWPAGTKMLLGENAIPEILPDCKISCDAILGPCCDKGYIQGFKHCQTITKEWLNRPVYAPFSNKEQEAYRQQMDQFINELTNSLYMSQPSKYLDAVSNTSNYTMAGLSYWRTFYQQLIIDTCCEGALDEAISSLADDPVSPDFSNTNIYIGLASRQVMVYLRNLHRRRVTIFENIEDFKGISPETWEIARTLGFAGVLAYSGDGFYVLFLESPMMTQLYPYQADLINYGTLFLTTVPEMNQSFQGLSFKYGGFLRRVNENNNPAMDSSFCPVTVGYEGMIGMEQFCASSNATLRIVECDCSGDLVLDGNDDSGSVDLPDA